MDLNQLPVEVIREMLLRVDGKTLIGSCSVTCRAWRAIVVDVSFWRAKCVRDGVICPPKNPYEKAVGLMRTYTQQPYGRNLIKNPNGEQGMQHWTVMSNGGDGFVVQRPPVAVDGESFPVCFATSYEPCIKAQLVDLVAEGCDPAVLDQLRPTITVAEWHAQLREFPSTHAVMVRLLRTPSFDDLRLLIDDQPPAEYPDTDVLFQQFSDRYEHPDGVWRESRHSFRDYPRGIRLVMFYSYGVDRLFWAGHYGPKMAGSSVVVHFD